MEPGLEGVGRGSRDDFSSEACSSEGSFSEGELLLHAPQGLGALLQLRLFFGLQGHFDNVRKAAVTQHARDTQEDFFGHTVHALTWGRLSQSIRLSNM